MEPRKLAEHSAADLADADQTDVFGDEPLKPKKHPWAWLLKMVFFLVDVTRFPACGGRGLIVSGRLHRPHRCWHSIRVDLCGIDVSCDGEVDQSLVEDVQYPEPRLHQERFFVGGWGGK